MNILGVDYGRKRIGLAIGDASSGFVFPLRSIRVERGQDTVGAVLDAAKKEKAGHIVVGVPRRLDGKTERAGDIEKEALEFIAALKSRTDITVDDEDERFTTALAERLCKGAGRTAKTGDKDAVAACIILESYILRVFNRDTGEWLKGD